MSSDITLDGHEVVVEGNLEIGGSAAIPRTSPGVATTSPARPTHVASGAIQSGRSAGGDSCSDRARPTLGGRPQNPERWVMNVADEAALLWSGVGARS